MKNKPCKVNITILTINLQENNVKYQGVINTKPKMKRVTKIGKMPETKIIKDWVSLFIYI